MYPRYKTKAIVQKYKDRFIKDLSLERWVIDVALVKSGDENLLKMDVPKQLRTGFRGITLLEEGTSSARILIFYDLIDNRKEAIGTLYHELLHIFLVPITDPVKGESVEEKFVLSVERRFLRTIK